jgi:RNA polymerase sigma-70 factor (ECF subfamily)
MSIVPPAAARDAELAELMHRCARGDQGAFRALYALTSPQLLALLIRMLRRRDLAEEVLQETFVSAWRNAPEYTASRGRVFAWLTTIARNRALDELRRTKRAALDPGAVLEELPDEQDEESYGPTEVRALIGCLDGLPDGQRRSVQLAYLDGLSHHEIAQTMRTPLGTVKSWVRRGLASLKQCLGATGAPA